MEPITNLEELPITFKVDVFAELFGVSRKVAFRVVKDEGLAVRVGGKRLVVIRDKVISWVQKQ